MSTPEVGDALPAAHHALRLALAAAPGAPWAERLVGLLEAAGGLDEANAVRRHLERERTTPLSPELDGAPAVLAAALRLHEAAEQDLRATLSRSGLRSDGSARPERQQRVEYAERALAERDAAVRAVLARLGDAATGFEPG